MKKHNRILERIFHSSPAIILDFLIIYRDFDYTKTEIAIKTGLSRRTVVREINNLINEGYVKIIKRKGNGFTYKITDDSKFTEGLITLYDNIIEKIKREFK